MRFISISMCFLLALPLYAADASERQQIEQRIAPVGQVRVAGQTPQNNPVQPDRIKLSLGQEIYEKHCIICHRDGVAGAPRFAQEADWNARMAQRNIEELVTSAIHGINAMPAKGTCGECSDDDIKQAIEYMLPKHDE